MSIYHLREEVAASFAVQPEFHMGFQVGRLIKNRKPVFILCAEIVLEFDQMLAAQIRTSSFRTWISNERDLDIQRAAFQKWVDDLLPPPAIELLGVRDAYVAVREINETPGFDPSTPSNMPPKGPDSATYGHLPFHRSTNDDEVFYRYESFPTSRRINQTTQLVAPGTFAAPQSELPFMPTGLSAVARCALPSLFPARWRWEIQPDAGTAMKYGASVPLYGQSGGGVEVMFPKGTKNRGPIANPVVLPIL